MPAIAKKSSYLSQCKEDFSEAYVHAVAAAAGCWVQTFRRDYDGVDGQITRYGDAGKLPDAPLRFQLKATEKAVITPQTIRYHLKVPNYTKLRVRRGAPAILLVVIVPVDPGAWLAQSEDALALAKAGYWVSLEGSAPTKNKMTKLVELPRSQLWSVEALDAIMGDIVEDTFP